MAGAAARVHMARVSEPPLFLDRRMSPQRSLSPRGLAILLAALVLWNALICGFLLLIGAWPVPLFLGLDLVGVAAAFAVSNRRARAGERVSVSALAVTVERGEGVVWTAPPAWTQVLRPPPGSRAPLRLTSSGRSVAVGSMLGAGERRRFAQALEHAVQAARAARW